MNKKTLYKIKDKIPVVFILILLKINNLRKYLGIFKYTKDFFSYSRLTRNNDRFNNISIKDIYPVLGENTASTGFDKHYTYHPAWAARIIAKNKPDFHVDISSILHFSTIVSAFVPVHFYDYRPADVKLSGLTNEKADLLSLPFKDKEVKSLSCMHVVEHAGLGRYGDKIDPDADKKAIDELKRVLAQNGDLLFVVPIGKPRIFFNAHRVYSYDQIISFFKEFKLIEFGLIPERSNDGIIINPDQGLINSQNYGCGCFWFKR